MRIPKPIQERRRSIRIAEALPFTIGHEGYEIEAVTLNIGYHGVMCVIERDIKMMTQLNVALTLPGAKKNKPFILKAKGVIVRKEKDPLSGKIYIAIYFSDIKPKDEAHLKEYIDARIGK